MKSNKDIKERRRIWRLEHQEQERIRQRIWQLANPEKWATTVHKSRQKRKESGLEKQYELDHKEHIAFMNKQRDAKRKLDVLSHYCKGNLKCARCGFDNIHALQIDHINGGGTKHRKELGLLGGGSFYRWLQLYSYPEGYQVLCANCNWIKRRENDEERHGK